MLYKTHKAGGTLFMLVTFELMRVRGWLLPDMHPLLQLFIMYPAMSWGSTAPDLDHQLSAVKEQTPFNLLIHKLLHLSNPKHRSWQTHSVLVTGGFCLFILALVGYLNTIGKINSTEWIFIRLVVIGGVVGIISHLLLDAFTRGGIHIVPGRKMRLVPNHPFFSTGGTWEILVFYGLMLGNICMGVYLLNNMFYRVG